jgi:hypothetical protein
MPNSTTTTPSTGLYFPGTAGSPASSNKEIPLHAYIERTMEGIEDYARREPWAFAAWVFGVGFVLGWKLKPW